MKRRQFIGQTALASTALLMLRCKMEKNKKTIEAATGQKLGDFGLQLWSVRDLMKEDPVGTLEKLVAIGYTDVESAGYDQGTFYGMNPQDFKRVLDGIGLKMRSCHTRTGITTPEIERTMSNNWEAFCEDNASIGVESVVCGWFAEEERKTLDDYKRHIELFNKCGEVALGFGLALAHHNHDFEFFPIEGQVPYDMMLQGTDPALVNFELDHYWIAKAGHSSLDYFKKYPGRFHYWHVKDMDDTADKFFTEVGSGVIDYPAIFREAELSGMKYFYVEQDAYRKYDPLTSVDMSHDYLKEMTF